MKKILGFIFGFVAGALFLFLILYVIGIRSNYSEREMLREKLMSELMNSLDEDEEVQVQYVEVKGKKGIVTLHTGMLKDSVQILVGKPDEVDLRSYRSTALENWGYKINNKYGLPKEYQTADLEIDFEDGKLKSVRQH